jgi:hypothetical protein
MAMIAIKWEQRLLKAKAAHDNQLRGLRGRGSDIKSMTARATKRGRASTTNGATRKMAALMANYN